jgi:hypothetical protein
VKTNIVFATTTNETTETTTTETTASTIVEEIVVKEKPMSLEEKYSTVFEWQSSSADFGVEQLHFLNEQCEKYEIPMELMLSLIATESSFKSDACAKTSSASGYCQIIKSTAKWIYEDKLNYGEYDVENHREIMTSNWRLNIEISCRLMYSLYHNNGKSWENAVKKYYGSTNPADNITYLNKVNHNMNDLFDIDISNL